MLKAIVEAVYLAKKGREEILVEVLRTPSGKSFVALHKNFEGKYITEEGDVKEWDIFELEGFKDVKDSPVEYESLPVDVRRAISSAFRY